MSECVVLRVGVGQQALAHTSLVAGVAVLAEFAFALQAGDRQAKAHNGLEHAVDIVGGGVADSPGRGAIGFMPVAQAADQCQQTFGIIEHLGHAISVYGQVIPGGYGFSVVGLAWVKGRADIGLFAGKDHQCFRALGQVLPVWIGPGQVPVQCAARAFVGVQQHRHMTGEQALAGMCDQYGQGGGLHLLVQDFNVVYGEGAGYVHGNYPWRLALS